VTAFTDLSAFVSTPRVTSLRLSPDGRWLAACVQAATGQPAKYVTSIWRIDTAPDGAPARLTRGAEGESSPEFLPDGSLLFASRRPAADGQPGTGTAGRREAGRDQPALWLLPAAGGEARRIAAPPGGVSALTAARTAAVYACAAAVFPGAAGEKDDSARRQARADAGVNAILHEHGLIRYWDHDLGPDSRRLLAGAVPAGEAGSGPAGPGPAGDPAQPRDLTPNAGRALEDQAFELTPDGAVLVTGWMAAAPGGEWHIEIAAIGVAAGARQVLMTAPDADFESPRVSPDGRLVLAIRSEHDRYDRPGDVTLVVAALPDPAAAGGPGAGAAGEGEAGGTSEGEAGGSGPRDLLAGFDRRPVEAAWAPDSRAVYFTADDHGRKPVFRVEVASGTVTRITGTPYDGAASDGAASDRAASDRAASDSAAGDRAAGDSAAGDRAAGDSAAGDRAAGDSAAGDRAASAADGRADNGAYDNLCPSPDGRYLYALRNAVDAPPAPVRLDVAPAARPGPAEPVGLASPGRPLEVPGRLDEVTVTAADGTAIRGWLVLPETASPAAPAPLLLWVHGGPLSSWNTWSWRWNPWLMAARGYAVLLPDPGLSTGYGQHMIERGHGTWGDRPYTDVMTITDAVTGRPDIDAGRTAMMGGSFGGYMANWIAGHTGRFQAIVSHAGVWALDPMLATTDWPAYWRRIFGDPLTRPERYLASSPHLHVADIATPMLVIHGDKDYRVPVGEALRLWADLAAHSKAAKFLYFPDENHWILKPGDATVWYETVFAFLAEHVLGEPWQRPELL
jgi:dipeptidyl aminopeptidase/acylaminoacyl peptidase